MRIVYRISEEDYVGARDLFAANEKPWYRRVSRRLLPWLGGLGIVLLLLRYVVVFPDRNPVVTAAGLMIGAYFLYCGFALRRYFRRSYQKDRRFQHDFTADVSEEGVHFVTPNSDSRVKWGGFVRFLESDEILCFSMRNGSSASFLSAHLRRARPINSGICYVGTSRP
jgi:hypothetical protein